DGDRPVLLDDRRVLADLAEPAERQNPDLAHATPLRLEWARTTRCRPLPAARAARGPRGRQSAPLRSPAPSAGACWRPARRGARVRSSPGWGLKSRTPRRTSARDA